MRGTPAETGRKIDVDIAPTGSPNQDVDAQSASPNKDVDAQSASPHMDVDAQSSSPNKDVDAPNKDVEAQSAWPHTEVDAQRAWPAQNGSLHKGAYAAPSEVPSTEHWNLTSAVWTTVCFCATDLCNAAKVVTHASILLIISLLLFELSFMFYSQKDH